MVVLKTEPAAAAVATAGAGNNNQQRAAKTAAATAATAAIAPPPPTAAMPCHWSLLPGEFLRHIVRAAAMVIDVACGPMAYKTQLSAYHYHLRRKPIVNFCDGMNKSDSDDIDIHEECFIFIVKIL